MLTFSERKKQVIQLCGINYEEPIMATIIQNMNTADKMFENAARRSWTRREKIAKLKKGQQYYQIASDMLRVATVQCRIASGSDITNPLTEVQSEYEWNKLNSFPFSTSWPTHFFIRGNDEIGIYPTPSEDIVDGLMVAYEPRVRDMGIDDFKFTADVVQNSASIINPSETLAGGFQAYMTENFWLKSTDGQDGNWYKLQKVISETEAQLDNNYLGPSGTGVSFLMGQAPPYPEEYHIAPVYYAAFQFFAMRKDTDSAAMYRTLFEDLLEQYKTVYGSKTASGIINPGKHRVPNITDVFKNSTLTEG